MREEESLTKAEFLKILTDDFNVQMEWRDKWVEALKNLKIYIEKTDDKFTRVLMEYHAASVCMNKDILLIKQYLLSKAKEEHILFPVELIPKKENE